MSTFSPYVQAASVPPTILTYQGRLTDATGNLLGGAGTTYYLKFSLWDSPTVGAGNRVWPASAPATTTTTVTQGVFTVNIGDTANGYPDALNVNFSNYSALYLQVEVSANNITSETLSPRQQMTSVPYAQVSGAVVGTTTQSLFGTTTPIASSFVTIQATSSASIPLTIAGALGQSANLFQIVNNSLTNLFSVSSSGTVTFASITSGLHAASPTGAVYSAATSSVGFSGPFSGASALGALVGGSNSTITWTGLATTSQPAASNLLVSNGAAGVYGVATSTLTPSSPLTGSFTVLGSGGTLGCQTANGSQAGCLSSTDWTTFSNKASFAWPFSLGTNNGVSTSTLIQMNGGASTTQLSANLAYFGGTGTSTFTSTGSLGIGTSSPAGLLDVWASGGRYSSINGTNGRVTISANDNNAINPVLTLQNTFDGGFGAGLLFNLGYGGSAAAVGTAVLGARIGALEEQTWTSTASTQDGALAFGTTLDGSLGERMRITSAGNVGIGTTTATRKLTIVGTDTTGTPTDAGAKGATILLSSAGSSVNDGGSIEFGAGGNGAFGQAYFSAIKGLAQNGTSNSIGDLAFYTRNTWTDNSLTERIRIVSGGNVGIGTTSPTYKLSVEGSSSLGNQAIAGSFTATSTTASSFAGNVGIGTTSPYAKLSLQANAGETNSTLFAVSSTTAAFATTTLLSLDNTGVLNVNGSIRSGVGNNSSSPSYSFSTNAGSNSGLYSEAAGVVNMSVGGAKVWGWYGAGSRTVSYNQFTIEQGQALAWASAGDGTSPDAYLRRDSTNTLRLSNDGTTGAANLVVNGKIGVGTTSPFYKLSVEGTSSLGSQAIAGFFTATSSVATSTFAGTVGIGTTTPVSQLSNTSTNALDTAGTGSNLTNGFTWGANGAGYVLSANNTSSASNANGLFVKIAGTAATNRLLSLNANGSDVFTVLGNGLVTMTGGFLSTASSTVGAGTQNTGLTIFGGATTTGFMKITGTTGTTTIAAGQGFSVGGSQFVVHQGAGSASAVSIGTATPEGYFTASNSVSGGAVNIDYINSASVALNNEVRMRFGTYSGQGSVANANYISSSVSNNATGANDMVFGVWGGGVPGSSEAIHIRGGATNLVGIGTSTARWNLQVAGTRPSFALSDTSAGTDLKHWLFSSMGGNLYIGTSTDAFGTSTPAAISISNFGTTTLKGLAITGVASTTSNVGINLSAGCFAVNNTCITGGVGGGVSLSVANVWSALQQFNANASSTQFSANQAYFGGTATSTFTSSGLLGIGTSSPFANLSIQPINNSITPFAIGSSTATLFSIDNLGNVNLANNATLTGPGNVTYSSSATTIINSGGNIILGSNTSVGGSFTVNGANDDIVFHAGNTSNTILRQMADDLPVLSVLFGDSTAGGAFSIGTTSPNKNWTLNAAGTRPTFALSDTSAGANLKHWLFSSQGGNLYIGTSTDLYATSTPAAISISNFGTTTLTGLAITGVASTTSNVGFNLSAGCFAINNTCVGAGSGASLSVANVWSALQQFNANASTTQLSATKAYFGGTATSTFTSTGFLGVGTTTPQWNLQVAGTRPSFALSDMSAGANLKHWLFSSMGGNLYIGTSTDAFGTSTPAAFTMLNGGNIGIGTSSPIADLAIQGADSVADIFDVSTRAGLNALHINAAGNVGLGTTTPQWNLQVAGTRPSFALSDMSAGANLKHWLFSSMGGNLYIGTSTDAFGTSSPAIFSISSTGSTTVSNGININSGCFAINGACIGYTVKLAAIYATSTPGTNASVVFTGAPGSAPTFTAGAPGTLTLPSNTSYVVVETRGSGGGGGGTGTAAAVKAAGGGGQGGYSRALINAPTGTYKYTVGAGGTAGAATGTAGGAGNPTCFGTNATACTSSSVQAAGGSGGAGATAAAAALGGAGGSSGTAGVVGDYKENGAPGANSTGVVTTAAQSGAGGGQGGGAGLTTTAAGNAGTNGGGGGGAATVTAAATANLGGLGGAGVMIITVYATSSPNTTGNDYAEMFPVSDSSISAGDIVAVDTATPVAMRMAVAGGKAPLAGIVSTAPGHVLGDSLATGQRPIAFSGRVPTKVNLEGGIIQVGDRIAPSSVPGVGKKAGFFDESVGIAMESYDGTGPASVTVFLDLQQGINLSLVASGLLSLPSVGDTFASTTISEASSTTAMGEVTEKTGTDFVGVIFAAIIQRVQGFGIFISDTAVRFVNIIADQLTVGSSDKPAGITIYDKQGRAGCLIADDVTTGALELIAGVCGTLPPATPQVEPPVPDSNATTTDDVPNGTSGDDTASSTDDGTPQ